MSMTVGETGGPELRLSTPDGSDQFCVCMDANSRVPIPRDILIDDDTKGLILKSPNGTLYRLTVADDGTLGTEAA